MDNQCCCLTYAFNPKMPIYDTLQSSMSLRLVTCQKKMPLGVYAAMWLPLSEMSHEDKLFYYGSTLLRKGQLCSLSDYPFLIPLGNEVFFYLLANYLISRRRIWWNNHPSFVPFKQRMEYACCFTFQRSNRELFWLIQVNKTQTFSSRFLPRHQPGWTQHGSKVPENMEAR
jgi:hypothetical protein